MVSFVVFLSDTHPPMMNFKYCKRPLLSLLQFAFWMGCLGIHGGTHIRGGPLPNRDLEWGHSCVYGLFPVPPGNTMYLHELSRGSHLQDLAVQSILIVGGIGGNR